jgi:uncharacterized YigZ family protein
MENNISNSISDSYFTISESSTGEFKDKGSKFIAFAIPFTNVDNLKKHLEEIKAIHPKARHFCWAYKIGIDNNRFRSSDDGEPSGSAGKPILNVILSKNLSDVLLVVVRYFGGTLLGVSGLINAYKSASLEAIANAKIIEKLVYSKFIFKYHFENTNDIMRIIKEFDLKILGQNYIDMCEMEVEIRRSLVEKVLEKIKELRFVEITFDDEL